MPIIWDQLPVEMRQAIVLEMDARTRVNLSMCSKSDNQLVRGTKYGKAECIELRSSYCSNGFKIILDKVNNLAHSVLVESSDEGGSSVYVNEPDPQNEKYSTSSDWKEMLWKIMSVIGTTIKVERLELNIAGKFQDSFIWLRDNIHVKPKVVTVLISELVGEYYDESIFDWPTGTEIELTVFNSALPNLERFNTFEKLVFFDFYGNDARQVTDEVLMKMIKLRYFNVAYRSNVTMNGFHWWLMKWLDQTNSNEHYHFHVYFEGFEGRLEFSFESVTEMLSDVIGEIEQLYAPDFCRKIEIKKNGIVGGSIELYKDRLFFESIEIDSEESDEDQYNQSPEEVSNFFAFIL